jgi:hypothetical protein
MFHESYHTLCLGSSKFFWTARGCIDGVSFHALVQSERVSASRPYCSSDSTLFLPGRVSGEQRGDDAETLSRIGVEHGN